MLIPVDFTGTASLQFGDAAGFDAGDFVGCLLLFSRETAETGADSATEQLTRSLQRVGERAQAVPPHHILDGPLLEKSTGVMAKLLRGGISNRKSGLLVRISIILSHKKYIISILLT